MAQEPNPDHACGRVCDYCTYNDIYIYFCIFCKKIITASREPDVKITIHIPPQNKEIDEYDEENLKDWI